MAIIEKKTWPEVFERVLSGEKKFDLRVADFDIQRGDELVLEEWDPVIKEFTGRSIFKRVDYVGTFSLDSFGQREFIEKHGMYIITLEDAE